MISKLTDQLLKRKEQTLRLHGVIVDALITSGFLEWLRAKGNVLLFNPADNQNTQANKAAFSAGYQSCIDDILTFTDIIREYEHVKTLPSQDYGARRALKEDGRITAEENINLGKTPLGY